MGDLEVLGMCFLVGMIPGSIILGTLMGLSDPKITAKIYKFADKFIERIEKRLGSK